ncbi:MAG: exodeoxyribonuclease VII large subunit [Gammaproteobacteria bacterium]|jgi:exodeoxyribonuclease VII large subunit|nr:exodeoxyribonuclease VII large subunit [Gammaproteobacteria bacterium]|tara:strand:+ start:5465 stop:6763 length:1299 start_codon:yes stop_codon:yes gene_type:complete
MSSTEISRPGVNREVISVSDLNRSARRLLEGEFPMVYVEGEISNFARPSSGHWYFTLKDDKSQLRCAMFRNRNQRIRFEPRNGTQIITRGKISLYEGRGEFQLIVEHMEKAGDGALRRAYEKLKADLLAEGLFSEVKKKPLPAMPRHVGIITSPSGAAIQDILNVMRRRFPAISISILPVQVQGDVSAAQIASALRFANEYRDNPFDIILLTRGGGSLEDLWSFNTEIVARAVHASRIPVVSAVGHESDVSIADFVADLRAPTPSAAAELITPDINEWIARLNRLSRANSDLMTAVLARHYSDLGHIARRLRHPGQRLQDLHQRLDDLETRLRNNLRYQLGTVNLNDMYARMMTAMERTLERSQAKFQLHLQKLNTLNPLSTLERGYAIVSTPDGHIIKHPDEVSPGDLVNARLAEGEITAEVRSSTGEIKK